MPGTSHQLETVPRVVGNAEVVVVQSPLAAVTLGLLRGEACRPETGRLGLPTQDAGAGTKTPAANATLLSAATTRLIPISSPPESPQSSEAGERCRLGGQGWPSRAILLSPKSPRSLGRCCGAPSVNPG